MTSFSWDLNNATSDSIVGLICSEFEPREERGTESFSSTAESLLDYGYGFLASRHVDLIRQSLGLCRKH
jgi:hypothetical protein